MQAKVPVAFRIVLALIPILLLLLIEGGLRIAGVARPPRYFLSQEIGGRTVIWPNPEIGKRFFSPSIGRVIPVPNAQIIAEKKSPGWRRILCIGASTAAGFPFPEHGSFPALLEQILNERDHTVRTEVMNCGLTGISSATVADLIDEMLRAKPDVLVIYLGHNEFYGAGGAITLRSPIASLTDWLRGLRIYRTLESILGRKPKRKPGTLMERLGARSSVAPDSRLRRIARDRFSRHLDTILDAAARAGTRTILCEIASNERNLYPFGSEPPLGSVASAVRNWQSDIPDTTAARESLPALESAAASDTTNAALHFLLGIARLLTGDPGGATDLRAARNLDTVPFRAPDTINRVIRDKASERGLTLVPSTRILADAAPCGVPGEESFVEHLHFTFTGNAMIASAAADAIIGHATSTITPADMARWLARSGLTACDLAFADGRIRQLYSRWPYTRKGESAPPFPYRAPSVLSEALEIALAASDSTTAADLTLDTPERTAANYVLAKKTDILQAHLGLAHTYRQSGRLSRAERHLDAATRLYPVDDRIWIELGEVRLQRGDVAGARVAGATALEWNPHSAPARELLRRLGP